MCVLLVLIRQGAQRISMLMLQGQQLVCAELFQCCEGRSVNLS
jgi:hypothetical protein